MILLPGRAHTFKLMELAFWKPHPIEDICVLVLGCSPELPEVCRFYLLKGLCHAGTAFVLFSPLLF